MPVMNLILWLNVNSPELSQDRLDHVNHLRDVKAVFETDEEGFLEFLANNLRNLSFPSAVESMLGIPAFSLLANADHSSQI